jgi:hypothetical protein
LKRAYDVYEGELKDYKQADIILEQIKLIDPTVFEEAERGEETETQD